MTIKTIMLGGAALLLATAAYASQPASSSAERAQTKDLNQQSLQAAQQGQNFAPQGTTTSSNMSSNNMSPSNDSAAANPAAAPTSQVAQNDMTPATSSSTTLAAMTAAPSALNTANVVDATGAPIGTVQKVEVSASGAPLAVDVALTGQANHVVAVNASSLTYNAADNVLTTQQSASQIMSMPNASQ